MSNRQIRYCCKCYTCTDEGRDLRGKAVRADTWHKHYDVDVRRLEEWPPGHSPPETLLKSVARYDIDLYRVEPLREAQRHDRATTTLHHSAQRLPDVEHMVWEGSFDETNQANARTAATGLAPSNATGFNADGRGAEASYTDAPTSGEGGNNDGGDELSWGLVDRGYVEDSEEEFSGSDDESDEDDEEEDSNDEMAWAPPPSHEQGIGAKRLQELVDGYAPDPNPPAEPPKTTLEDLTQAQLDTLDLYRIWLETRGTQESYRRLTALAHRWGREVASLHEAKKLAGQLSAINPDEVDMCKYSCIAYTGKYKDMDCCPWPRVVTDKEGNVIRRTCQEPRRTSGKKPQQRFLYIPLLDRLRAMFNSPEMCAKLQYRDQELQTLYEAQSTGSWEAFSFIDAAHGLQALHWAGKGDLFKDARDVAVTIATDGAQLSANKDSSSWFITASLINVPPHLRFKRQHQYVLAIIPGPEQPGDIESFFYPVATELAKLGKGFWTWDATKREWFVLRAHLVALYADQPGSSKLNKMTGTQGKHGCRMCMMQACYAPPDPERKRRPKNGARGRGNNSAPSAGNARTGQIHEVSGAALHGEMGSDQAPGEGTGAAKADKSKSTPYFPLFTPTALTQDPLNVGRPAVYDAQNLPLRTDDEYREQIAKLAVKQSKKKRSEVVKETGIKALPLLAFSPAFSHPHFFPLDVFHLFSYNTLAFLWEAFHTGAAEGDPRTFSRESSKDFGILVADSSFDVPGVFGVCPRDPHLRHNSHYKMVEWIAVFHRYIGPYFHANATEMDPRVLDMINALLDGIGFALSEDGCRPRDIRRVAEAFEKFCCMWEELYVRNNAKLLNRARMSFHLLLHVARHISSTGSMVACSQAACERTIGLVKAEVNSHKDVFETVMRRSVLIEQIHMIDFLLNPDGDATNARISGQGDVDEEDDDEVEDDEVEDDEEDDNEEEQVQSDESTRQRRPSDSASTAGKLQIQLSKTTPLRRLRLDEDVRANVARLVEAWGEEDTNKEPIKYVTTMRMTTEKRSFRVRSRASLTVKTKRAACRVAILDEESRCGVSFVDVYAFAYSAADNALFAIGKKMTVDTISNHWIQGSWEADLKMIDAVGVLDLMGQFSVGGRLYLYPRKTAMGGFVGWWADFCRMRELERAEQQTGEEATSMSDVDQENMNV